jgi:hypothetical protein
MLGSSGGIVKNKIDIYRDDAAEDGEVCSGTTAISPAALAQLSSAIQISLAGRAAGLKPRAAWKHLQSRQETL